MIRLKKVFKDAQEGMSVSQAMLKNGYKPGYAKNPQDLKKTDAWQKLLAEKLPDDDLLVAHRNALGATKWNDFTGEREADHSIRLRAAVEGYKLKGKMLEKTGINNTQVNINWDSHGYMPPNNTQNVKQTYTPKKSKGK